MVPILNVGGESASVDIKEKILEYERYLVNGKLCNICFLLNPCLRYCFLCYCLKDMSLPAFFAYSCFL